jgi:alpha-1,6-mannosyltransferase
MTAAVYRNAPTVLDALMLDTPSEAAGSRSIRMGADLLPAVRRRPGQLTVLDVTKWFGETSGGVRTYLQQKSEYVAAHPELRHVLVIPAGRDLVTDQDNVRWYRLRGPRVPRQPQYRFLLATRSLRRIIAHERPDVIEVGSPVFVPWVVARAAHGTGIPLISFYHTSLTTSLANAGVASALLRNALGAYARRLDRLFLSTLVASDSAAAELRDAGVTRTVRVPLGVDLNTFAPWRRARARETRCRHDLPERGPLVVYAGRLALEKSLEVAIDGWRRFDPTHRATLAIVGQGPLAQPLAARAAGTSIRFLPFQNSREDVADLLAASDAYLAPSPVETFGLAALEALACGTPVVAADRGGVAEQVRRSNGGVLFHSGDADSLADALRRCLGGQPDQLGAVGRAFVEREHGWDHVFDRIFSVYRRVLDA